MKKYILISITFFYSLTQVSAQATYTKETEEQIRQVENGLYGRLIIDGKPYNILDRMAHYNVKGLSMAVVQDYKIVWAKGYGFANEKEKRPVTKETLFKPGSISKSLNAVGVLRLAQDNQVDLYTDINKYLKSWKFPYDSLSKGKKITLANLLSHTAGLSVYGGFPGYDPKSRIPTVPQLLDGKEPANTPPVRSLAEPGIEFQYSGGGTIISQLIITDVTHQPYEKFMYDSVLKPLGMKHSFYSALPPSKSELAKMATGYTKEGLEVKATFRVYPEQAPLGLWTNPTELCNYLTEMQLAYKGWSSKVLNQKMSQLHLTPYVDGSSAMGVFIGDRNGEKYFFHDAANEGFRGLFYGSVDGGNGVVIFVNSDEGNIILELLNSVASAYNWKGFDKPVSITTKKIPAALANTYLGVYLYDGNIAEITQGPDGLYYWANDLNCRMYFTSDKDFINMEFPTEKSFLTDEAGNVKGYARKANGAQLSAAVKITRPDTLKTNKGQISSYGWRLLETKRFDEATKYLSRGRELDPDDPVIKNYLAHAYLFKGEYKKAIKLYRDCIDGDKDAQSVRTMIKQDLDFFKKSNYDKVLIAKVFSELGLK